MHEETLVSTTIDGEGTTRIGSFATTIVEPGGGNGAAVAWGVYTVIASLIRGVGIEESGHEAVTPKSHKA